MDRHDDIYKNSFNRYQIEKKEYKKMPRAKVWQKRILTMALITGLALTLNIGVDIYKNQQMKTELMLNTTKQMLEVGYKTVPNPDGSWDQNYYLLKDFNMLGLYSLMGQDEVENVLKVQGYQGWQDYLEKTGYSDISKWRKAVVNEHVETVKQR